MRRIIPLAIGAVAAVAVAIPTVAGAGRAAGPVTVTLKEFTVKVAPASAKAGKVTFVVRNAGALEHELEVIRWGKAPGAIPLEGDKAKVPSGAELGEVEDIAPGATKRLTLTLSKGSYALICNLRGHYKAGQRTVFKVT
ncbi:MAG: hypothetical protein FJW96_12575 [Actinobacteria bacterium]|nr:hypothetical protein [Actinomycetota bacterium]